MSSEQWVAIAALGVGAIGTLGGLAFGFFNSRSEREHSATLAKSARLHSQRYEAYVALAALLERQRQFVGRTEPASVLGKPLDPPEQPPEEEWFVMQGRVDVAGSDAVEAAVKAAQEAFHEFSSAVSYFRMMHWSTEGLTDPVVVDARQDLDAARTRAYEAIDGALRQMRQELASL